MADRDLRALTPADFDPGARTCWSSTSIGVAFSSASREDADELLRNADVAMYTAKSGKAVRRAVRAEHVRGRAATSRLKADLQRAIEQQRVHACTTSRSSRWRRERLAGVEALRAVAPRRARHDPAGRVHPARGGDRADLPARPLRCCSKPAGRRRPGATLGDPVTSSVNLSTRQLQDPRSCDVAEALAANRPRPRR